MGRRGRDDGTGPDGLLIVDKPAGLTSHDVVGRVRRLAGTRRVGHAGTLDPMATGVLVLGLGKGTKLLTFLVGCDKTYDATIRLGIATVTDDAQGEVVDRGEVAGVTDEAIRSAVGRLTGQIDQVPSAVSAIKIDGKRSYARVREGEQVELAARRVTVSRFDIHDLRRLESADGTPVIDLDVSVDVSSGTYVRALARDLGADLRVGGHLTALRRSRVGGYTLDGALNLDAALASADEAGRSALPLIGLAAAARAQFPVHELSPAEATSLRYGQRISSGPARAEVVAAIGPDDDLVAVLDESAATARSHVVFPR